jgi:hypothetical protein
MKKTYIAPEMEVVNIETVNMIAASLTSSGKTTSSGGVTSGDAKVFDDWDEDLDDIKLW